MLNTLDVDSFIARTLLKRQDPLYSDENINSLDKSRDCLNKIQPMAGFMFDADQELISYVATKQMQDQEGSKDCNEKKGSPDEDEYKRLL